MYHNSPVSPSQFPQELVTYGGNGQVFSNWAQFWLAMHYLSVMEDDQTLVMYSGHPMGLFPSHPQAPRCVITNGMVRISAAIRICLGLASVLCIQVSILGGSVTGQS